MEFEQFPQARELDSALFGQDFRCDLAVALRGHDVFGLLLA